MADSARNAAKQLTGLHDGKHCSGELQDDDATSVARAFFQQIHPAHMSEYSASRQADAWHDWYPDHWNSGNGSLIDAYTSRLQPAISLNTRVLRCRELEGEVRLEYETAGTVHELSARSLIVATPATIARELASPLDSACAEFLHGVRCGRYAVVAFALAMTPGWGYGMDDAVVSGRTTGALVKAMLEHDTGGAAA